MRKQRPKDPPPNDLWAAVIRIFVWPLPKWLRMIAILLAVTVVATFAIWTSLPDPTKQRMLSYVGVEGMSDSSHVAGKFYAELADMPTYEEAIQLMHQVQKFADAAAVARKRPSIKDVTWTYPRGVLFASSDVSVEKSLDVAGKWIVAINLIAAPQVQLNAEDKLTQIKQEVQFFLDQPAPDPEIRQEFNGLLPRIVDAKVRKYDPVTYQRLYHRDLKQG